MGNLAIRGGKRTKTKPFPKYPQWNEQSEKFLIEALHSGRWARGPQDNSLDKKSHQGFIEKLEQMVAQMHNSKYALAVASGTAALDLSVRSIGIKPGDEVIVSPYSFVASATCVLNAGATPVFADIRHDTWNLDMEEAEKNITDKTKAVVVVHFGGQPADMDSLRILAGKYNLKIIEDAAHAMGAAWNGNPVGNLGDIGCFSLQSSKNVTCGEGGLVVTSDLEYYKKAYSLHISGRPFGGAWYQHEELGWNYRITEFQAAVAVSQLERINEMDGLRRSNAEYLYKLLDGVEGIELLKNDSRVSNRVYHLVPFRYYKEKWEGLSRKRFIMALNAEGIPCHEGYIHPIYKNTLFLKDTAYDYAAFSEKCPVTEKICGEAVWMHQELFLGDRNDMEEIAESILKIRRHINEILR